VLSGQPRRPCAADWDASSSGCARADSVALACHVGPDGDALGSMLALGDWPLRALGKRVVASWGGEPFEVPRRTRFLPGLTCWSRVRFPAAPALWFTAGHRQRGPARLAGRPGLNRRLLHRGRPPRQQHPVRSGSTWSTGTPPRRGHWSGLVDRLGLPLTQELAAPALHRP
jgi:hypothetical protein